MCLRTLKHPAARCTACGSVIQDEYHAELRQVRKIHSYRKRLGVATLKGRKFTPKAPVTAENVGQNKQWIQLLLASSERAWAHAMAMKSAQSPENTQKPMLGSTKKQIVSRYRRAILYAENLVEVVQNQATSGASDNDVLEAKAYLALLKGGLAFEKRQWETCLQNYAVARVVYLALSASSKLDTFKDLLSATVDPSIKYAAYQLKLPRTRLVSDIAVEKFPPSEIELRRQLEKLRSDTFNLSSDKSAEQSDQPSQLPSTITWRSRRVKIEDAAVSQTLGIAQDKEATFETIFEAFGRDELSTKDLALSFDDVINAQQDVADVIKNAIDELREEGTDQGDHRVQSLQIARTAINFAVIEWRVGRNRILCGIDDGLSFEPEEPKQNPRPRKDGKTRSPKEEGTGQRLSRLRERLVLYESTLQSIDAVKELPGVIADETFVEELKVKRAYFQALKCIAVGRSQALGGNSLNALALYSRASSLTQTASAQTESPQQASNIPYKINITFEQAKALQKLTTSLLLQYQALVELSRINKPTAAQDSTYSPPLIERFNQARFEDNLDLKNLVNYPPKLQPIPVKPLFFDLAWNYIQYPGQGANTNVSVASSAKVDPVAETKPAKKGWFGFGR